MHNTGYLYGLLIGIAAAWGLTNPLAKIAVSTGYMPLGIMFWQLVTILVLSGALTLAKHHRLPFRRDTMALFSGIALVGTLLPDYVLYLSAAHLPAGILSILLGLVPVFALPIALILGFEKPETRRMFGIVLGAAAIFLMLGPKASLPVGTPVIYAFLTLMGAMFYAMQGNFITWHGGRGLDAVQILFGSSLFAFVVVAPAAVLSGQFVSLNQHWGAAEWAILGTFILHAAAYGGFFALVARAGPVFTSQVAYLVTGFGVLWSMLLLSETYSLWVWLAFALMVTGILLLRPRRPRPAL